MFQQTPEQTAFLEANDAVYNITWRGDKGKQCEIKNVHTGIVFAEAFADDEPTALNNAIEVARTNRVEKTGKTPQEMEIESLRRQLEEATKGNITATREKKKGKKKSDEPEPDAE